MTRILSASPADELRCQLGEGPLWDAASGRLLYVDIEAGRVLAHDPDAGSSRILLDHDDFVTAVLPHADGSLLVGLRDGLGVLDPTASAHAPRLVTPLQADDDRVRCNDATVAPDGAVLIGTMDLEEETGHGQLHRVDEHGAVQLVRDGLTVSNGLGFSPDGHLLYHADTPSGRIDALTLGAGGEVTDRRTFVDLGDEGGLPDGLTVDAEGAVWTALWSAGVVRRYLPDGTLDAFVEFPVSHPTSCAFGGPDLDVLYVTTGGPEVGGEGDHAGALFRLTPGVRGLAVPRAAIPLDPVTGS
ncbi:SMP-30/gluconolactonase/LRE family protein [Egicoccus halophilus]|uniref:Calcium-binding protein n=1 Tax=Egicoccus halophilus TaxID=1670830 RepID=A0A8J3EUF0_9ACTN|nr:SMP-30/gluconolactonase/LRE family protein [Egicoccus halophilus]GGI07059.1 calcium-binding protein [Egicoccus halophilus]